MICTQFRLASLVAVLIATASAAQAGEVRLVCEMTDYSGGSIWNSWSGQRADRRIDVRELIPEKSVHVLDGEAARIEGTDLFGSYSRDGRQRQMNYVTRVPELGEARITYTYIISSGQITARVLFPQRQQNMYIDRIAGTCKRQG